MYQGILKEQLSKGKFVTTMEIDPPRGANPWPIYDQIKTVAPYLTAVNIADSPTAKLRMSPIALAHLLQDQMGLETIFHLTCRDRNLLGLQSELLGAHGLGVRNILTLTGDKPEIGDHPQATGIFDVDSVGLAKMAYKLNQALDYMDRPLADGTDLYIGGVANPAVDDLAKEVARIEEKIANGVQFFQTQPIYSLDQLEKFMAVAPKEAHYIYGLMPLKGAKQAHYLNAKVPGVKVPETMIAHLEQEGGAASIRWLRQMIGPMKSMTAGIHIFPMGDYSLAQDLLREPLP